MPCFDEFSVNSKYHILLHLLLVMLLLKHKVKARKKANGNFKKPWELLFFSEVRWQTQVISYIAVISQLPSYLGNEPETVVSGVLFRQRVIVTDAESISFSWHTRGSTYLSLNMAKNYILNEQPDFPI